jgi:hypothetical protein
VVTRDLRDGTWSRHDTTEWPTPDVHAIVLHADDDYVFVESLHPGPAIEVYSMARRVERCTRPRRVKPLSDSGGYELRRDFNEPGAPLRNVVRRQELEAAFESLR